MNDEIINDQSRTPHDSQLDPAGDEQTPQQKKPFVQPVLTRHATLPTVTTGFFGVFSP